MIYRVIRDENDNLIKEPLAGNPQLQFDTCIDSTSENAVENCVIATALDTKLTKPDGVDVCWPDNTLLQWSAACNELVPIACQPTLNNQALVAKISSPTTTVYSSDGTTFYNADFSSATEPSGTAGTPTAVGDFYKYLATWYKKDGADYYEVNSFTDAGTLVTDAALITELDGHTFLTYSSIVYTEAAMTSYEWSNTAGGGAGIHVYPTRTCWEAARLISIGQPGYIADGDGIVILDETNYLYGEEH